MKTGISAVCLVAAVTARLSAEPAAVGFKTDATGVEMMESPKGE